MQKRSGERVYRLWNKPTFSYLFEIICKYKKEVNFNTLYRRGGNLINGVKSRVIYSVKENWIFMEIWLNFGVALS